MAHTFITYYCTQLLVQQDSDRDRENKISLYVMVTRVYRSKENHKENKQVGKLVSRSLKTCILMYSGTNPDRHFSQRFQLFGTDEVKFGDKVVKMLVAGVYMSFLNKKRREIIKYLSTSSMGGQLSTYRPQCHNPVKMVDVNMYEYSE